MNEALRRAVVTAAVIAGLWGFGAMPLPFVTELALGDVPTLGAVGVRPFVVAAVLVETLALLSPGLRRARVGPPEARRGIDTAARLLGLGMAAIQSWTLATLLQSTALLSMGPVPAGPLFVPAVALTLLAGSAVGLLGARAINASGLGQGLVCVYLGGELLGFVEDTAHAVRAVGDTGNLAALTGAALLLLVAWRATLGRWRGAVPVLPAGVVPASETLALLALIGTVGQLLPGGAPDTSLERPAVALGAAAVLGVLTWGMGTLFHRPGVLGPALGVEPEQLRAELRQTLPAALAFGVLLVTLAAPPFATLTAPVHVDAPFLTLVAAWALDLRAEWRAWSRPGAWAPAWELHRVGELPALRAALAARGIEAWDQGTTYRSLLCFFGPYAPIRIFVAAERVAEARALLRERAPQ